MKNCNHKWEEHGCAKPVLEYYICKECGAEKTITSNVQDASNGCGKHFQRGLSLVACGRKRRDGDIELCQACSLNLKNGNNNQQGEMARMRKQDSTNNGESDTPQSSLAINGDGNPADSQFHGKVTNG